MEALLEDIKGQRASADLQLAAARYRGPNEPYMSPCILLMLMRRSCDSSKLACITSWPHVSLKEVSRQLRILYWNFLETLCNREDFAHTCNCCGC